MEKINENINYKNNDNIFVVIQKYGRIYTDVLTQ